MKTTVLLATALFLASAPTPDSETITEISGGFLSYPSAHGLLAADVASLAPIAEEVAAPVLDPETPRATTETGHQLQ